MYFVGNVLSPTLTQPEQEDPTFAFTYGEGQMDMNGIPICMEHDEKMQVGTIKQSWNQLDGSKWIVGKIDDMSMFGHFARNAVQKSSNGTRYYTGLSLTHTHTQYANGKTEKAPVEVSLCVDPRRSDCRIMFVDESELNALDQRKISTYKASVKTKKMSAPVVDTPMTDATPAPAAPVAPAPVEQAKDEVVPNQESLMKMIVDQQKDMERLETQAKELEALKAQIADQKKKEFEVAAAKNEAMAKALVESWSQTLDQEDMNDASRHSIIALAKKFPHESQEFFRVAHNASKKSLAREKELKEAAESLKNADLKKDFSKVMNKTTHVASKKKAPKVEAKSDETHFMDAVRKYRVSGSGRALMEQVAEIGNIKKRRRMF